MAIQMQRPLIVFHENDSEKSKVTKLNEFIQLMEKRVSALETGKEDIEKRFTEIELNS